MAANSDGQSELTTILTCEGNLSDPRFPAQLDIVVGRLNDILCDKVKVHKLEPWNSVRVTLSIPREAALRLRQLANEGSQQLRALGILSVQVEGDQVISLRLATGTVNSEPQEIVLRTAQDGGSTDRETDLGLLSTPGSTANNPNNSQVQFKSPNVVCPSDSVVPKVSTTAATSSNVSNSGKAFVGPFPFASMNQAIHSNRETPFNSLPPPYPGKHPPVTISSPLLVNLLQNDGPKESNNVPKLPQPVTSARSIRTPPVSVHKPVAHSVTVSTNSNSTFVKSNPTSTQANVLVNNSISPSALSTNTSIRQNSTILTSTTGVVNKTPPPQYNRSISTTMAVKQQPSSGFPNATNTTTIVSQINSMTQTSVLSQQNFTPISQASTIPQASIYHSQTQTKNPLLQNNNHSSQNSVSIQSIAQPIISPSHSNVSLSQQIITKSHSSQSNTAMPQLKNISNSGISVPQTKTSLLNILPQSTNINVLSQVKSPLAPGISTTKNVNNFISRPIKNQAGGFGQSVSPNTILSQPNTVTQTTTLPSHFPIISTTSLSNCSESITNSTSIVSHSQPGINNILSRGLPSPPPYSVAISRPWDTSVHSNNSLLDLNPSITDLKPDVLDELLPTLERELSSSPLPELPEDFLSVSSNIISTPSVVPVVDDKRKFLINPLTGELEPHSGGESDTEELKDVFTGLPSPAALSDEDTSSTTRPDVSTDHSDNETRNDIIKPRLKNAKVKDRGRDSPALKQEKIKLRLKLEKSEPINPAYKVDVSFINTQPKKAATSMISTTGEELRVPPLHISLRGRNSVVIKNKNKLNPDGTPVKPKVRKNPDHLKIKKSDSNSLLNEELSVNTTGPAASGDSMTIDQSKVKISNLEQKKFKKFKTHDHKEIVSNLNQENDLKSKFIIHNHYKDKQKERRGSDSELVRSNKKYVESNGINCNEKKRRLSQTEHEDEEKPTILGSTNIGTIAGLPQKPRKDKMKIKDIFKKEAGRNKIFNKTLADKVQSKQVTLPTAGEMNMEAKFKQGLLEGTGEKNVQRQLHRTEVINLVTTENSRTENIEKLTKVVPEAIPLKEKSPEPDKCNTPDRKLVELNEKQTTVAGSRSPNSGAGQGEDSGIESMDALSEKSPNQASQSPHADILPPKTQVPMMLDIEAQLAKMEGLNGDTDRGGDKTANPNVIEDVNENKCHHDQPSNLKQCCELTCALQDSIKQGTVSLTASLSSPTSSSKQQAEISLVSLKVKKEENPEPLPVRVTPALYTYSNQNPDKSRVGSESPTLSDEDSNSCSTNSTMNSSSKQNRSLLEQLLIEIPNDHQTVPSSPSPATRSSVRTRALSKLGSPELSSPVTKNTRTLAPTKRKRNESDSSNHSLEEAKKKPRKSSDVVLESVKSRQNDSTKVNNIKKTHVAKVQHEESSDSDEPLIEKLRKTNSINTHTTGGTSKTKIKSGSGVAGPITKTVVMNTRRSVRSNMPAQNTRSKGDKIQSESEALRRKTRSADVESKRKKEVK